MNDRIVALERELLDVTRRLAEARRSAEPEVVASDYVFRRAGTGEAVRLSELFEERGELVVVHNMGRSCAWCTLWADGMNGLADALMDRVSMVVSSPDEPEAQAQFAAERGWRIPMVSTAGTTFAWDMGFEEERGVLPGVSAFAMRDGAVVRTGRAVWGPGDQYCPAWHVFDLLPGGPGEWQPRISYG